MYGRAYTASPEYAAKLAEQGYDVNHTFQGGDGKTYNHDDVHEAFEQAYVKHRGENIQRCGASTKENKKIRKRYQKAIEDDVKDGFHFSWAAIGFGVLLLLIGGPIGFIVCVIAVLFEYYLNKDIEGDKALRAALAVS